MTISVNACDAFDMLYLMPQDIVNHIGRFYITKQMKFRWRIHNLYNKSEELEKRTIDEWIEHIKFSKRYNIKIVKIKDDAYIKYTNSFGDTYKLHKDDLLNQGYIAHIRHLYRMYVNRIISETTPYPKYVGELFTNIVGEKMIATMIEYGDDYEDIDNFHKGLAFIKI